MSRRGRGRVDALLVAAALVAGGVACREARLDNCADPGGVCARPEPSVGAKIINDFEAAPAATSDPVGCTELFVGENCSPPLRNALGLCANTPFCAFHGSLCASQVTGADAFRKTSWRMRFNESLITDASAPTAFEPDAAPADASVTDGSTSDASAGYPFSGYTERLSGAKPQGPGCDETLPPFDASPYTHLTFWVKAEAGVDFEIALKSDKLPGLTEYPETVPKISFVDCQGWQPQSCICDTNLPWRKVCIPLIKLQPAANPATQVNLNKLLEVNLAFAASPYVIDRHERAAAEITIDDLAFETLSLASH